MSIFDFWSFSAEMRGRPAEPTRFFAEQMERAQDVQPPQPRDVGLPSTYTEPNAETSGAVTQS